MNRASASQLAKLFLRPNRFNQLKCRRLKAGFKCWYSTPFRDLTLKLGYRMLTVDPVCGPRDATLAPAPPVDVPAGHKVRLRTTVGAPVAIIPVRPCSPAIHRRETSICS